MPAYITSNMHANIYGPYDGIMHKRKSEEYELVFLNNKSKSY